MGYWLDETSSQGSGSGMFVSNSGRTPQKGASSGGGSSAFTSWGDMSESQQNGTMFGVSAAVSASGARTDAIVKANNDLSWYYSIVQDAMNNQTITFLDKLHVTNAGIDAEKKVRRRARHAKGNVRTVYAGRNIRIDTGSPVDVIDSVGVIEAADRQTISTNTQNKVGALELKRLNFKRKEEAARNKASTINPSARGNEAFLSSILSSAGQFAAGGMG